MVPRFFQGKPGLQRTDKPMETFGNTNPLIQQTPGLFRLQKPQLLRDAQVRAHLPGRSLGNPHEVFALRRGVSFHTLRDVGRHGNSRPLDLIPKGEVPASAKFTVDLHGQFFSLPPNFQFFERLHIGLNFQIQQKMRPLLNFFSPLKINHLYLPPSTFYLSPCTSRLALHRWLLCCLLLIPTRLPAQN